MIGKEKDINNHIIALPKAVNPYSYKELKKAISYFESCKIIIVDRDPRDLYFELLRSEKTDTSLDQMIQFQKQSHLLIF